MASILVVSADPATRETLRASLEERGHTLSVCQEAAGVVRAFTAMAIDLACIDAAAGAADSIDDICRWLPADSSRANTPILFVLPLGGRWTAAALPPLFRLGCDDCLPRPPRRRNAGALSARPHSLWTRRRKSSGRTGGRWRSPAWNAACSDILWSGRVLSSATMSCWRWYGASIRGTGAAPVVRVHVGNLRRKMAALGGYAGLLQTPPHRGCRLLQGEGC